MPPKNIRRCSLRKSRKVAVRNVVKQEIKQENEGNILCNFRVFVTEATCTHRIENKCFTLSVSIYTITSLVSLKRT